MDKNVKNDCLCYQILFNKPLCVTKRKYIYGFRLKVDELKPHPLSEKLLLEYIVEHVFGKCLFQEIHNGDFCGYKENIWIDKAGNEYKCGIHTRLYSYDATVENMMNYRCDLVYAPCEGENDEHYWITDPAEYFEQKAKMDENDHKSGKNQWSENYYRIQAQRKMLSNITFPKSEYLDYDIQELIKKDWDDIKKGCPKLIENEEYNKEKEDYLDRLPF